MQGVEDEAAEDVDGPTAVETFAGEIPVDEPIVGEAARGGAVVGETAFDNAAADVSVFGVVSDSNRHPDSSSSGMLLLLLQSGEGGGSGASKAACLR